MRIYRSILFILLLLLLGGSLSARGRAGVSLAATPYLDEDLMLHVELDVENYRRLPVRDIRLYYREYSESRFRSSVLRQEGLRYLASVNLSEYAGGLVEYFIDVEYADGSRERYPEEAPDNGLMKVSLQQDIQSEDGIVVISPEPGEDVFTDEFILTVSFFQYSSQVDKERTVLFLDSWDVSRYVNMFNDFLTFAPRRVPPGEHKLRLELYDRSGQLIARRNWSFLAYQRTVPSAGSGEFEISGNAFAEARSEELLDGLQSRQYNKAGLLLEGETRNFSIGGRLFVSNQEKSTLQPINRYSGWAQYNFWNNRFLRFTGGDAYPQLNPFLMENVFLRGFHGQAYFKFINFDYTRGTTLRDIEGRAVLDTAGTAIDTAAGTFKREVWAARVSFGDRQDFQWGFTVVKGKDDVKSISYGQNPEESAGVGSDLYIATRNNSFVLEGSINASSYNPNILDGENVSLDSLQEWGVDISQEQYDLVTGIITVNQYLIVKPAIAYHAQMRLNFFNNRFSILYKSVEEAFHSLGQPFLLRDNKGFAITDDIRLFRNQFFLNLRYQQYENNLNDVKPATTTNRTLAFNISYFPLRNLPSLTLGYSNYRRSNGITSTSTVAAFPEDNQTNTITFSTSYNFLVSNLRNRATLNVMNYNRTDETALGLENLSNTVALILNTRYNFPLRTNLEFAFQQTENTSASQGGSDLSFNSFGLGAEYEFGKLFSQSDNLILSATGRYGAVASSVAVSSGSGGAGINVDTDYNRSFLNGRLIYSYFPYGRVSLNADLVNYSGDRKYKDYIITARYDVTF